MSNELVQFSQQIDQQNNENQNKQYSEYYHFQNKHPKLFQKNNKDAYFAPKYLTISRTYLGGYKNEREYIFHLKPNEEIENNYCCFDCCLNSENNLHSPEKNHSHYLSDNLKRNATTEQCNNFKFPATPISSSLSPLLSSSQSSTETQLVVTPSDSPHKSANNYCYIETTKLFEEFSDIIDHTNNNNRNLLFFEQQNWNSSTSNSNISSIDIKQQEARSVSSQSDDLRALMMRAPANLYRPNACCQTNILTTNNNINNTDAINNATSVSLNQINQVKPLAGGQRMALKLGSKVLQQARELQEPPVSPVPPQQQQQQQQQHQHWQASQSPFGIQVGSENLHDDPESDCSCSNSLDCLTQNCSPPLSSASHVHLELAHISNSQQLIQHHRQHHIDHHQHHHQNDDCSFINPHQHQHQNHRLQSFNQHQHQNHQQQQHHPHQRHHHHHQQQQAQLPPPPPPPPPPPLVANNHHLDYSQPVHPHHQQHRPIMHHSSVPTYVGSNAPSAIAVAQQQQQHPVMQPPQAPLVRQATYTATSETITDNSLQLHPSRGSPPSIGNTQMLDRNNIPPEFSDQHNKQPLDEYHGGMSVTELPQQATKSSSKHQHQQQQLNSLNKRQTVSFRRSATADQTEDVKQIHKHQQHKQNCQPNPIYNGDDKGNLDRRDAKLYRQRSAAFTVQQQQQQLKSEEINLNRPSQQAKITNSNKRDNSNDNDTPNEQHLANQYRQVTNTNRCPGSPILATQSGGGGGGGMNSSNNGPGLAGSGPGPGSGGHIHHQTPVATYPQPVPLTPASIRAAHLLTSNNTFDGISLPAVTSHRTNSPWMRISSIILTPIGIVIILFIVVSPLLHYLM